MIDQTKAVQAPVEHKKGRKGFLPDRNQPF